MKFRTPPRNQVCFTPHVAHKTTEAPTTVIMHDVTPIKTGTYSPGATGLENLLANGKLLYYKRRRMPKVVHRSRRPKLLECKIVLAAGRLNLVLR